jgi:ElaB/YqjD/DUF883 family membrane-anchored ribosome-binding protein
MTHTVTQEEVQEDARELRARFEKLSRDFAEMTKAMGQKVVGDAKDWATDHPAAAVGIVAGVSAGIGLLIGLMVGRGRN